MTIAEAQNDVCRAYVDGGPGQVVSGVVWLAAATAVYARGISVGFAVLFGGGVLIFGVTTVICRFVFGRAPMNAANPLGRVVLESTIAMMGGLFAACLFLGLRPAMVFPVAAIAVGTHYASFRTAYGSALFWVLAGLLTAVGFFGAFGLLRNTAVLALTVGLIEIVFGCFVTQRALRRVDPTRC
ncbi:DUF7010 family protein [Terriglobus sp.]|uniref:DUF7010 family protein n=1 Tax=Terriglobus sp. TaxID=1889013 RepID=UPI003B00910C